MKYAVGDVVEAKWGEANYTARIVEVDENKKKTPYKVHYQGWNQRWNEWIADGRVVKLLSKAAKRILPPSNDTPMESDKRRRVVSPVTSTAGRTTRNLRTSSDSGTAEVDGAQQTAATRGRPLKQQSRRTRKTSDATSPTARLTSVVQEVPNQPKEETAAQSDDNRFYLHDGEEMAGGRRTRRPNQRYALDLMSGNLQEHKKSRISTVGSSDYPPYKASSSKEPLRSSKTSLKKAEISAGEDPSFSSIAKFPPSTLVSQQRRQEDNSSELSFDDRHEPDDDEEDVDNHPQQIIPMEPDFGEHDPLLGQSAHYAPEVETEPQFIEIQEPEPPPVLAPSVSKPSAAVATCSSTTIHSTAAISSAPVSQPTGIVVTSSSGLGTINPDKRYLVKPTTFYHEQGGSNQPPPPTLQPMHHEMPLLEEQELPNSAVSSSEVEEYDHYDDDSSGQFMQFDQDDPAADASTRMLAQHRLSKQTMAIQGIRVTGSAPVVETSRVFMRLGPVVDTNPSRIIPSASSYQHGYSRTAGTNSYYAGGRLATSAVRSTVVAPLPKNDSGVEYLDPFYSPSLHVGGRGRFGVVGSGHAPPKPPDDHPDDFVYLPPEIISDHCYGTRPPVNDYRSSFPRGRAPSLNKLPKDQDGQTTYGKLVPAHLLPTAQLVSPAQQKRTLPMGIIVSQPRFQHEASDRVLSPQQQPTTFQIRSESHLEGEYHIGSATEPVSDYYIDAATGEIIQYVEHDADGGLEGASFADVGMPHTSATTVGDDGEEDGGAPPRLVSEQGDDDEEEDSLVAMAMASGGVRAGVATAGGSRHSTNSRHHHHHHHPVIGDDDKLPANILEGVDDHELLLGAVDDDDERM